MSNPESKPIFDQPPALNEIPDERQRRQSMPETDNKILATEVEKKPKIEFNLACKERPEIVDSATKSLEKAFSLLGVNDIKLPLIKVEFVDSIGEEMWLEPENREDMFTGKEDPLLLFEPIIPGMGKTYIKKGDYKILFDTCFATARGEASEIEEFKKNGVDYPGVAKVLEHEIAHIALWSLTGLDRQPATRLLDEGFARFIENAGHVKDLDTLAEKTREKIRDGLKYDRTNKAYKYCIDLNVNSAAFYGGSKDMPWDKEIKGTSDYDVGEAFLIFFIEKFGLNPTIELLKKSPSVTRRNDELQACDFEKACIDSKIHNKSDEYAEMVAHLRTLRKVEEPLSIRLNGAEWEYKQFKTAINEVSGLTFQVMQKSFKEWLGFKDSDYEPSNKNDSANEEEKYIKPIGFIPNKI